MRAGPFNRRIRIERQDAGRSASGQPVKAPWTLVQKRWASILYSNGRQYVAADREISGATVSIRIRYGATVDPGMRVVHDGQSFEILAVLPDEVRREHIDLACSAGVRL